MFRSLVWFRSLKATLLQNPGSASVAAARADLFSVFWWLRVIGVGWFSDLGAFDESKTARTTWTTLLHNMFSLAFDCFWTDASGCSNNGRALHFESLDAYFVLFCSILVGLFHFAVECLILMSCFEAAINHANSKEISLPLFHKMEGCWLERLDDGQSAAIAIPVRVWNPFRFFSVAPSLLYSLFHSFQELDLCTQEDSLTARHRDPVQRKNTSTKITNAPHRNAQAPCMVTNCPKHKPM